MSAMVIGDAVMRDRTVPVILPDCDSNDLQDAYKLVQRMTESFNASHTSQIVHVQFDLTGQVYGGNQRDYRGCYVSRDRVDAL